MSGDGFDVEDLIACYRQGVFPMAEARDDERIYLIDPPERGIIPLDGFHVPHRLARTVRQGGVEIRIDSAFAQVLAECARSRPGRDDTWINPGIEMLYREMFARGLAHSVECWRDGQLVGGLYGVCLHGAFFGESMFSNETDASKTALVHLVARLRRGGYALLDAQFMTGHLSQFGCVEIAREDYRRRLKLALAIEGDFFALPPQAPGVAVLQAISHAS